MCRSIGAFYRSIYCVQRSAPYCDGSLTLRLIRIGSGPQVFAGGANAYEQIVRNAVTRRSRVPLHAFSLSETKRYETISLLYFYSADRVWSERPRAVRHSSAVRMNARYGAIFSSERSRPGTRRAMRTRQERRERRAAGPYRPKPNTGCGGQASRR